MVQGGTRTKRPSLYGRAGVQGDRAQQPYGRRCQQPEVLPWSYRGEELGGTIIQGVAGPNGMAIGRAYLAAFPAMLAVRIDFMHTMRGKVYACACGGCREWEATARLVGSQRHLNQGEKEPGTWPSPARSGNRVLWSSVNRPQQQRHSS